jgi:hypothetical protein
MFTRANQKIDTSLSRDQVIDTLKEVAQKWQEIAREEGQSLLDMKTSPGLLLYDVVKALDLIYHEQEQILKADLFDIKLATGDPITIKA